MPMNLSKGNMYDWVTHTWNAVKGQCPHVCAYCYMRRWGYQPPAHLDDKELTTDLGRDNKIFVGSSCDLFAADIPVEWIRKTLRHCYKDHPDNTYVFQSKNPARMIELVDAFRESWKPYGGRPTRTYIGTTIESNIHHAQMGNTPPPEKRARAMKRVAASVVKFVTIEPVMDFDVDALIALILKANPASVNIGADSGGHNLPEPPAHKVVQLIERLVSANIVVKQKDNLRRIMG